MMVYKTIGKIWIAGWLIIGLPYTLLTHVSLSSLFESFLLITIFFSILIGFGELRDYIRKRANDE